MRRVILIAAFGLISWFSGAALFCEGALHVPRHRASHTVRANTGVIPTHDVEIAAADRIRLWGSFFPGRSTDRGCVLLLHGVADSRSSTFGFASVLVANGYSVLAVDSRAHGASGGELVTYGLLERGDVLRWAGWLRARGCRAVYGLGESMGAAILIQAAAEKPVFSAIVAECPFADLGRIGEERVVQVIPGPKLLSRALAKVIVPGGFLYARLRYGLDLRRVSPVEVVARMKTPVLIIHGLADTNIRPSHSMAIASAGPSVRLWLVPHAGHTTASAQAPAEFASRVLAWFHQHRPASNTSPASL